jgi:hypothetical protein
MYKSALRLLLISILLVNWVWVKAQNLTKSPYSIIGVGEIHFYGSSTQSSLGQTGQGFRRVNEINVLNPASFSALKYTVADGGALWSRGTLSRGNLQQTVTNFSFSYFMFGVPLSARKKVGMAFGLSPYSSLGYNVSARQQFDSYDATITLKGTGGLNRFHAGIGAQILPSFSVGINANYIFGQTNFEQKLLIPAQFNQRNLAETRRRNINDFQYNIGAQYHKEYERGERKDKYAFVVGATYTLGARLNATEDYFIRSLGIGNTGFFGDTIMYEKSLPGIIQMPRSVQTGVSFEKKDHWMVCADVNYTQWSAYRAFGRNDSLQNSFGFGVGWSFIPNFLDYKHYYNRVEYRLGARYESGNVQLSNIPIATYGVSAGIGLPLGKNRSRVNISGEYFIKGANQNNLIREEYFRFIIGLNFSDKWFQRYRYD